MFKVGLTGGIASGKSAAANFLAKLGALIIKLDDLAKEVVSLGTSTLAKIHQHFGDDILMDDGSLNRAKLREIIFNDKEQKAWLEALMHPAIRERQEAIIDHASREERYPYVVIEIPLLVENNLFDTVDRVLVIDVEEATQIARASERDKVHPDQIESILKSQASRTERNAIADDIIENNGSIRELETKISALHKKYIELAQTP